MEAGFLRDRMQGGTSRPEEWMQGVPETTWFAGLKLGSSIRFAGEKRFDAKNVVSWSSTPLDPGRQGFYEQEHCKSKAVDRTRTALRLRPHAPNGAELKGRGKWFFGEVFRSPCVWQPIPRHSLTRLALEGAAVRTRIWHNHRQRAASRAAFLD